MASDCFQPEDLDDSINLESKVLWALMRLQNRKNKKIQEAKAVSCGNVVQFLKANYSWLDGDIQSQVKTALLSFVKNGMVCYLDNSKYRLLVPNSRFVSSTCLTRTTHGPNCSCLFALKCTNSPNICCVAKKNGSIRSKIKSVIRKVKKRKSRKQVRFSVKKSKKSDCFVSPKKSPTSVRKRKRDVVSDSGDIPSVKVVKKCKSCSPQGQSSGVPCDIFSPRDEVNNNT